MLLLNYFMAYWLMKSEPDCYGIDHLKNEKKGMWEGCRNYTVRNFLRDQMKVGDLAFFHHSSVQPPGIVGIMKIVSEAYPDPTQFDPRSEYFDPKAKPDKPIWFTRDVEFVQKFNRMITLAELKSIPGLEKMLVIQKGQRLSIMPVTESEWKLVTSLKGT